MISTGYTVRATYLAFTTALRKRLLNPRLTSAQWYFMREIWIEEGLSQRELSERVGTAESTTVAALRVLERRKFIYREAKPRDRRSSRVYLTDNGRKMRDELMPVIAKVNREAVRGLSKLEVEELSRLLNKVRANLKAT